MAGLMTLQELQAASDRGEIDTVVVCLPRHAGPADRQALPGRVSSSTARIDETHGCDYLLANDIDMEPVPGYEAANWEKGYGDFVMKPDLATLR